MKITHTLVPQNERKSPPEDMSQVVFGTQFTDHMFLMNWTAGKGWHSPRIEPYGPITLDPSALVFHYGQEAFEGLKAYRKDDGHCQLFRPHDNFLRYNKTAERMCMPPVDVDFMVQALKELVKEDQSWIPEGIGMSLYLRPTVIATETAIGLKSSSEYLLFIIMCPVGPYYSEGFNPVKIMVSEKYVRSVPGGTGAVKTGGNYAASNLAEREAKEQGFTQVLWLDAVHRKYVEEVGSMNLFFVINGQLVTPELTGSILPGITRDSVLKLAKHWGMDVSERRISIDEVIEGIQKNSVTEIFGSGTAALIAPVGELHHKGTSHRVSDGQTGPITQKIFDELTGIQYGNFADPFGWVEPVA